MEEKIAYWKSNRFLGAFVRKEGEKGCLRCPDEDVRLSIDCLPPPLRDQPPAVRKLKPNVEVQKKDEHQFIINVLTGMAKIANANRRFREWVDSPAASTPESVITTPVSEWMAANLGFDLQDIPRTIHALGMHKAAFMFDKWFEGRLNYSPTDGDSTAQIDQYGKEYASDMIDLTSISIEWVLGFKRASHMLDELVAERIYNEATIAVLCRHLTKHIKKGLIFTADLCNNDIQKIHREFQFQKIMIEGSLSQKISQYLTRDVFNHGIPDELTLILGSFNLYAAVNRVVFGREFGRDTATITHIYVYARDGFTFTDQEGKASQYLGHWGRKGVAIVPLKIASSYLANQDWVDFPVVEKGPMGLSVLYPVKNSDFRAWQLKHQRGGDYIIYTSRKSIFLKKPIAVVLS